MILRIEDDLGIDFYKFTEGERACEQWAYRDVHGPRWVNGMWASPSELRDYANRFNARLVEVSENAMLIEAELLRKESA